jgi:hypothetical protein
MGFCEHCGNALFGNFFNRDQQRQSHPEIRVLPDLAGYGAVLVAPSYKRRLKDSPHHACVLVALREGDGPQTFELKRFKELSFSLNKYLRNGHVR